jgi:two-component system, NarL family, sensor histidine kinase LiaS
MRSVANRFGTLRWRLILSCFVAALTAMLTLEFTFVIVPGIFAMTAPQRPASLVRGLQGLAPRLATPLRGSEPDRAQLLSALMTYKQPIPITEGLTDNIRSGVSVSAGENATLSVIGQSGSPLAAVAPAGSLAPALEHARQSSAAKMVIAAALRNDTKTADLIQVTTDGYTVAATPIVDSDGTTRGALFISVDLAGLLRPIYLLNLIALLPTVLIFAFIASIVGAIFGMLTARGLTQRLLRLTSAADAWSKGDFMVSARDASGDELGQLARDLNRMAEQLQNLLRDRQQLAVVEERNRLARELHDSVKQQVFALTMLVGSAQLEVAEQSEARRLLGEAERIAASTQKEMAALIQALRPVALANQELSPALRELCHDWEKGSGISCDARVPDGLAVRAPIAQQVFRVTQEALANIAKHSGATRVELNADVEGGVLALRISDNGQGFDVAQAQGRGLGLTSMRERVEELNGAFHISSSVGGTRLDVRIPLAEQPSVSPADSSPAPTSPSQA